MRRARKHSLETKPSSEPSAEEPPPTQQSDALAGEVLTRLYTPLPSQDVATMVIHRHPCRERPFTCHREPGAQPEVEGRIIGTRLQTAVAKPPEASASTHVLAPRGGVAPLCLSGPKRVHWETASAHSGERVEGEEGRSMNISRRRSPPKSEEADYALKTQGG